MQSIRPKVKKEQKIIHQFWFCGLIDTIFRVYLPPSRSAYQKIYIFVNIIWRH